MIDCKAKQKNIVVKQIEHCRNLGIDVLKPTRKQLEYGLQLHKQSLVWDAYGFAPSGAPKQELISSMVNNRVDSKEFKDRMEQYMQTDFLQQSDMYEAYRITWEASGVDCIFQSAGEESNSIEVAVKRLARYTYLADKYRDLYERVSFPDDVTAAKKNGRHSLYLSCNGVPLPAAFGNIAEALMSLKTFFQLGVRMMHITYNRRNLLGDGCAESKDGGLSDLGKEIIHEMNKCGIIPDVSHCGQRTSLEVAEISRRPVVASHSFAWTLHQHYRGKNDEVIRQIAKSGGYVGICCIPHFLGGSGMLDALLDHVDYIAENFGTDHVAIGTDREDVMGHFDNYDMPVKFRPRFEALWPESSSTAQVSPLAEKCLTWTNWPLITVGLHQRGYSDKDICKIIGTNVLRVTQASI
jgi:membrane dipeptidase